MAPSRRKDNVRSSKSKTKEDVSDQSWRSEIENLTLNEERWTCVIGMIVESRLEHEGYLELFNEAAQEGTREAIYPLSYAKLVREAKLLAKSDPRQGICHFASKQMDNEGVESMGTWLVSRLIKYFVNRAKIRNLEILESRMRIEKDTTKEIEILAATGTKEVKSFDKQSTKLRKRGEEWRDKVPIDDAPIDGPDLYVVLSGFYDPMLPSELLKAGLPLTVVFRVTSPGEDVEFDHPNARDFWSSFEATLRDPETAPGFGNVICQSFCPPQISRAEGEDEAMKSDAYRRISFLMYDLADIIHYHASYIKKMKLQPNLDEVRPEFQPTETYDAIMNLVPEECASVSIVLDALLTQVEGLQIGVHMEDNEKTVGSGLGSQIEYLNEKFDLLDVNKADNSLENVDPRFILHGDDLGRENHHCSWRNSVPEDFGVRVLRQSVLTLLWNRVPALTCDQDAMHAYHIGLLSDCFDPKIDNSTTCHYLHVLLFDKMANAEFPRSSLRERDDLEKKVSFPSVDVNDKRGKSETNLCYEWLCKNSPSVSRSDSAIEYGKEISKTFECLELFRLVDTREMFGSSQTASPPSFWDRNSRNLDLGDFDSVEFMSSDVFSQVFSNNFQEFNSVETRYFAPSDSMLVVLYNDRSKDGILERGYTASIRTPVCLRDFSRFIIDEEKDWIEKEEETHAIRVGEKTAAMRKPNDEASSEYPLSGSFYTDADFILPNSIKGSEVRREKSRQSLINRTETSQLLRDELPARVDGTRKGKQVKETNSAQDKGMPKKKSRGINPGRKSEERLATSGSFTPLKKMPSTPLIECQEPSTFLGYDVADHRVQVSGSTSEFRSDDGTVVKVKREEWTYGTPTLQIIVKLNGNDLVMHNVGNGESTFNFTAANGISMAFRPIRKGQTSDVEASSGSGDSLTKWNYQGSKTGRESDTLNGSWSAEMAVDPGFRVSWPSGLVVEVLPGDSPSDTFNIKQSYLSKGPECTAISNETERVYLRDGTMIVFRNDESVLLMRSSGCVANCSSFSNPGGKRTLKILRGTVLQPDGKRYEILNGEIFQEVGEELVITSSDYEVDEKFTRRNDGTNILIDSEGFLAVCFPDGSRITTGYVIDEHPLFCEWTEDEIRKFYPDNNETESILRGDGFVSVLLTCCMEHKNYATVAYDQSKNDCTLSMPGDVRIHILSNTLGVTVGTETYLEVKRDEIVFSERTGKSSVFNLDRSTLDAPLLRTMDSFGDVFTVDLNGKTTYKKSDSVEEDRKNKRGYRLFAVNRDLSAYEYLHPVDKEAQENEGTAVIFQRQVPRQSNQKLCTTLTTPDPMTASQAWLQSYRVPSIRPTNEDRRDLVRSTYSIPSNYLIPYGKNGLGIRDRTWNLPLNVNGPNYSPPKVLLGRTIQTIRNREDNVIKKLQTALGRYWEKAINNFCKYRNFVAVEAAPTFEEREFDDWFTDFALGRRNTFDRTLYFDGLNENRTMQRSASQISRTSNSELDDKMAAEEIKWYKNCLRDRTMVPYFCYIRGACFLWVLECVNKVGEEEDKKPK